MSSPALRKEAGKTQLGFNLVYLPHYFFLEMGEFHPELIGSLDEWVQKFLAIEGFRGCTKSTNAGLALPLYAALNKKANFILPINETDDVVRLTIAAMREELEQNELILADYGNVIVDKFKSTKATETNILLANGVRIFGRSRGQKVRGLKHRQFRPDLVIIDDPEEREKIDKKEYRDKTEHWIRDDVIPGLAANGRLVVLGNRLHKDSLMPRLASDPRFKFIQIPLIKGEEKWENCTWKARYPTPQALKDAEEEMKFRSTWLREMLLKVVPEEGQIIKEEDIHYYDTEPAEVETGMQATVFDLAISKKQTADYTAGVTGKTAAINGHTNIFVQPEPINERLDLYELIQRAKLILATSNGLHLFGIEDVAYQKAAIIEFERNMLPVEGIKPIGDKIARLKTVAPYIKNGTVKFPRKGCELLIGQLLGFGVEDHDDLVDALVYLILFLIKMGFGSFEVKAIN